VARRLHPVEENPPVSELSPVAGRLVINHHSSPLEFVHCIAHTTLVSTRAFFFSAFMGNRVTEQVDVGSGSHAVHNSSMSADGRVLEASCCDNLKAGSGLFISRKLSSAYLMSPASTIERTFAARGSCWSTHRASKFNQCLVDVPRPCTWIFRR
jgi:hypothetical protein